MATPKKYAKQLKHGHSTRGNGPSPTYTSWCAMITRCTNTKQRQYKDYGGRGIVVCPKWKEFTGFLEDMGEKPEGMTLDRIDNSEGYYADNCRWATTKEQAQNTRRNRYLTFKGELLTLQGFSDKVGLKRECVAARLRRGWTVEQIATTPLIVGRPRTQGRAYWKYLAVKESKK